MSTDELAGATIHAEGWQSWSSVRLLRTGEESDRAGDEREQTVSFRPGKPVPKRAVQAEGVLAVAADGGGARAWFGPEPSREVPTLRIHGTEVFSDGTVEEITGHELADVLAAVARRLAPGPVRAIAPGWSSWSCYFKNVTEAAVIENAEMALRLEVPLEIVQLDEGYETAIGDWLERSSSFGSLPRLAEQLREEGLVPGIWTAPFLVDPQSTLAARHSEWLIEDADAGTHWGRRMRILDIRKPAAAQHLAEVYRTLRDWGFAYHKLDFLYAGAIPGEDAYREGMQLIRAALGADATVLASGAPLLPSIGLCDAMRVGPDVLPEIPDPQPDVDSLVRITTARAWMNHRLWINDPDHLVARPQIKDRERWAAYLVGYGGLRFASDRFADLDERGLEITRGLMSTPG